MITKNTILKFAVIIAAVAGASIGTARPAAAIIIGYPNQCYWHGTDYCGSCGGSCLGTNYYCCQQ